MSLVASALLLIALLTFNHWKTAAAYLLFGTLITSPFLALPLLWLDEAPLVCTLAIIVIPLWGALHLWRDVRETRRRFPPLFEPAE